MDIYENIILCEKCNKKTKKGVIIKEGYKIRMWKCPSCNKQWYHPLDLEKYKNFEKLKNKNFQVKLRLIGNSFCVSIPREIIKFEQEIQKQIKKMNNIIHISLEEPEKLSLYFSKRFKELMDND